jgi:hypothetical protein
MALPIKTTDEDIEVLANYLNSRVGWTPLSQVKSTVPSRHADNRKIEAMRYIGLLDRNDEEVRLTDAGHAFARSTSDKRAEVIAERLKVTPLYNQTLEWMHFQNHLEPNKTEVAQYWDSKQSTYLDGAQGAALTDAAIFFMRVVGMSGLGVFVAAGTGRDTHVEMDAKALAAFVTGTAPAPPSALAKQERQSGDGAGKPAMEQPAGTGVGVATLRSGVNIKIEVHLGVD